MRFLPSLHLPVAACDRPSHPAFLSVIKRVFLSALERQVCGLVGRFIFNYFHDMTLGESETWQMANLTALRQKRLLGVSAWKNQTGGLQT